MSAARALRESESTKERWLVEIDSHTFKMIQANLHSLTKALAYYVGAHVRPRSHKVQGGRPTRGEFADFI